VCSMPRADSGRFFRGIPHPHLLGDRYRLFLTFLATTSVLHTYANRGVFSVKRNRKWAQRHWH